MGVVLGNPISTGGKPEQAKTVIPTKVEQNVVPDTGKSLGQVIVKPIPAEYITTTDANATAGEILAGQTAYVGGVKVEGTMANNGATGKDIDGISVTSYAIPAGYTTGGTVRLDGTIETALAEISGGSVMSVQGEIQRLTNAKNAISSEIGKKGVAVPAGTKLDGLSAQIAKIQPAKPEQAKTVEITQNGPVVVAPDPGKVLSSATVNVNVPTGPVNKKVAIRLANGGFFNSVLVYFDPKTKDYTQINVPPRDAVGEIDIETYNEYPLLLSLGNEQIEPDVRICGFYINSNYWDKVHGYSIGDTVTEAIHSGGALSVFWWSEDVDYYNIIFDVT